MERSRNPRSHVMASQGECLRSEHSDLGGFAVAV